MIYYIYLGLLYSGLLYLCLQLARKKNYDTSILLDLCFCIMVFGLLGARLTHVFFESPELYAHNWSRVFDFAAGGYVFFGGAIAAVASSVILLRIKKQPFFPWADFFSPVAALGYGLGRISCLLAGCCYGGTCEYFWAIDHRHPTQIYATIWELVVFLYLIFLDKRSLKSGSLFFTWLALHGMGRLLMENFRDDFRGPQVFGTSISTVIAFALVLIGIFGISSRLKRART